VDGTKGAKVGHGGERLRMGRSRRLFGTDGVRGVAGEFITADLAMRLGRAATEGSPAGRPGVLVIRDTRESGEMLQAALAAGVASGGGDALLGGILPTPAASLLVRRHGFDLAVVLSASHNPFEDNGIKFFGPDGYKLSDEQELAIEELLDERDPSDTSGGSGAPESQSGAPKRTAARGRHRIGGIRDFGGAQEDYVSELHRRFAGLELGGLDVLLDCAHGATFRAAPEVFRRLGARVSVLGDAPDGRNINAGCGSTYVERLAERVLEGGHAVGFAFDGDGDRVLAVDRSGQVVDGDELMALVALHLRAAGRLVGDGVVVTVMTNYGFHRAMEKAGIAVATTAVGDRYVLEELRARGWVLGGEQSGHVIELGFNRSGDGIATALLVLEALGSRDLCEREAMQKLPQRLVNVRVRDRDAYARAPEVLEAVRAADEDLRGRGRVLVRPSGTEPLVRVMVEAPSEQEAGDVCSRLVELVERELGASV
jgi:phosphoglucosamine mutase